MSGRLVELMQQMILKEGQVGKAKLSQAAARGERMIDRYIKGESAPSADVAYRLALACGCTDEEALKLAKLECPSDVAKEAG